MKFFKIPKLNYKLLSAFFFLIIIALFILLVKNFNFDGTNGLRALFTSLKTQDIENKTTFYIPWDRGAVVRSCASLYCEQNYSFGAGKALELPYSGIEEMPEWVDVSNFCNKNCFVHKSVFTSTLDDIQKTSQWEDRTALIICDLPSSGSGLLAWSEGQEAIITAKHLLQNNGRLAQACAVSFSKQGHKVVSNKFFRIHEEHDIAIIILGEFNENIRNLAEKTINVCQFGEKGDKVSAYGYPAALENPTPTYSSGEINNMEELYYFITANIGPGHSGGVIIKQDENCYLGMPVEIKSGLGQYGNRIENVENWGKILKSTILHFNENKEFSL